MSSSDLNININSDSPILTAKMLSLDELDILSKQLNHDLVDFADIYMQYCERESWSLDEGIIKSGTFSISQGTGVRSIQQEKTAFIYSDQINFAKTKDLISASQTMLAQQVTQQVNQQVNSQTNQQVNNLNININSEKKSKKLYNQDSFLGQLSAAQKIQILQMVDELARQNPLVFNVSASLVAVYDAFLLARSDARIHSDARPMVRLSVNITLKQNDKIEMGHAGGGGRYDFSYFNPARVANYVQHAIDLAMHNLSAKPAPAGVMDVVLGNGWPGILLHEAVGHGLEADFNRRGTSLFSQKIGQQVAAKGVTIVDDGTLANQRGSLHIDDEGNPSQYNILIEDGILKKYMQDELNARLMNQAVTGNGRRESYACLPMPRMTNTYMLNASPETAKTLDEMIGSIEHGIYAQEFGGGQVDITNGQFVFSASQAFLIENGKLTQPLKGVTLIGSGSQTLHNVTMIGADLKLDDGVGTCGKDGQSVPVGVGQPSIKIQNMTVGGSQI